MAVCWVSAYLDLAPADFERGVAFWRGVTGYGLSQSRGERDQFATLVPPDGDDFLRVQRLDHGPTRVHLDVHDAEHEFVIHKSPGRRDGDELAVTLPRRPVRFPSIRQRSSAGKTPRDR